MISKLLMILIFLYPMISVAKTYEVIENNFKLLNKEQGFVLKTNEGFKFAIRHRDKEMDYLYITNFYLSQRKEETELDLKIVPIKKSQLLNKGHFFNEKGDLLPSRERTKLLKQQSPLFSTWYTPEGTMIMPNKREITLYTNNKRDGEYAYFKSEINYGVQGLLKTYGFGQFVEGKFCATYNYLDEGKIIYISGVQRNPEIICFEIEE